MPADKFRVYLHGAPGSSAELDLFGDHRTHFDYAPDRFGANTRFDLDALAHDIATRADGRLIYLTGFSMGGYIALEVAPRLGPTMAHIDLIAAPAPLNEGDFLSRMAGKPLFTAARDYPARFALIVSAQSAITRVLPRLMVAILFATSRGDDVGITRDPDFKRSIASILRSTMAGDASSYRAEIEHYVKPWGSILREIAVPVSIWQGKLDSWVPFPMAEYLRDALPNVTAFHAVDGASHYSTLRLALARAR